VLTSASPRLAVSSTFWLGDWRVDPALRTVAGPSGEVRLEPKPIQVLVQLAEHPGQVVTKDQLLQAVWADTFVGDEVLSRTISDLRRVFGDDPKSPRVIQTIPKGGYRLLLPVSFHDPASSPVSLTEASSPIPRESKAPDVLARRVHKTRPWRQWLLVAGAAAIVVSTAGAARWQEHRATMRNAHVAELCRRALDLIEADKPDAAATLLDDALRAAPSDPYPRILRACAMFNRGDDRRRVLDMARQAVDFIRPATDPKVRYFTTAGYWHLKGDLDRAARDYEALLQLDATNYWAVSGLAWIQLGAGKDERAADLLAQVARLRPNNALVVGMLGEALVLTGDVDGALPFAHRACDLLQRSGPPTSAAKTDAVSWAPWSCTMDLYVAWIRGRPDWARQAAAVLDKREGFTVEERDAILMNAIAAPLGFGNTPQAERWAAQISLYELRVQSQAVIAYVTGQHARARALLANYVARQPAILQSIPILTDIGLGSLIPRQIALRTDLAPIETTYLHAENGWARGDRATAVRLFDSSLLRIEGRLKHAAPLSGGSAVRIFRALLLSGRDAEQRGDVEGAITLLEDTTSQRAYACGETLATPLWLQAQSALVRLYEETGQHEQARMTTGLLRRLLADAHPAFSRWLQSAAGPVGPRASEDNRPNPIAQRSLR